MLLDFHRASSMSVVIKKKKRAKLNDLAHDRLDLTYATSCLASAVSSPSLGDMQAAKRVWRYLRKAPVAWQGFPIQDPRPRELLCCTDADWASDKTSRRSTSGGVVKKQKCCTVNLGKRAVRSHHVGHEIFDDAERVDGFWVQLQCDCRNRQPKRR